MLSVVSDLDHAECHYAECRYGYCHYGECRGAFWWPECYIQMQLITQESKLVRLLVSDNFSLV